MMRLTRPSFLSQTCRNFTRGFATKAPTAVVMMNMGGPATLDQVGFFLNNLFSDPEIIKLGPLQNTLGPYIAKRRTPKIIEQYDQIGGGSPIGKWTDVQGKAMTDLLDKLSPDTAPHKHYTAFRYAHPLTEQAVDEMVADGVTRAVAFSEYPHWSCTTTGSSMNHLNRTLEAKGLSDQIKWSVVDRWPLAPGFIQAVAERIVEALPQFEGKEAPTILFSAHSLPQYVVSRGDPYANEIAATSYAVMKKLEKEFNQDLAHMISWQSKVGFLPWLSPSTSGTLAELGKRGKKSVLVVPIAFTSDHIETLFEIDIEYREEAEAVGIENFHKTEGLNASKTLIQTKADLVLESLTGGKNSASLQYPIRCVECANPDICRPKLNPAFPEA